MNLTITPKISSNYSSMNCDNKNNRQQQFGDLNASLRKLAGESDITAGYARRKRDITIDKMLNFFNNMLKKEGKSTQSLESAGYELAFYPKYQGGSPMSCKLVNRQGDAVVLEGKEVAVDVSRDFEETASKNLVKKLLSYSLLTEG